MSFQNLNLPQ
jgi:hypothetical protein